MTCPLSLLKDALVSGDGEVGHKPLAVASCHEWNKERPVPAATEVQGLAEGNVGFGVDGAWLCHQAAGKAFFIPGLSNQATENERKIPLHFRKCCGFRLGWAHR